MLISKYRSVLKNMSFKNAAVLAACCLLAGAPSFVSAENIDYIDTNPNPPSLATTPILIDGISRHNALFPKLGFVGNTVTVNYSDLPQPEYVFGGLSGTDTVTGNSVFIKNGTIGFIYGGYNGTGGATSNSVAISGGTVTGDLGEKVNIYGGYSEAGDATNNGVTISGGKVYGDILAGEVNVYGGFSYAGAATDNRVTISGGVVDSNIYGGYSVEKDAVNNSAIISGGTMGGSDGMFVFAVEAYGGFSEAGDATGNSVTISGGAVTSDVYGGYSKAGDAANNSVTISGGTVGYNDGTSVLAVEVYGGYSEAGDATDNSVIISGGTVTGDVYGGYSEAGTAADNSVTISGGTVTGDVYGGFSEKEAATDNSVIISGDGKVSGYVYGGVSVEKDAINNSVIISGGTIDDNGILVVNVYGGYSETGNATDNSVAISGGTVTGGVYGGYSEASTATDNVVAVSGGTVTYDVYGGYSEAGTAADNSVTISGDGEVNGPVMGGGSYDGAATGNSVTISGGGKVNSFVLGGVSVAGDATNNSVTLSGDGEVNGSIYGGVSEAGAVMGNSVTISGGTVRGNLYEEASVYGGFSGKEAAKDNIVIISGDGEVNGNIYGGVSIEKAATNNSVTISGGAVRGNLGEEASVCGGFSVTGDATDNSVTVSGGVVGGNIYGGVSIEKAATNNSVIISGGTAGGYDDMIVFAVEAYGGFSAEGNATDNSVTISGGTVAGNVYGGFSETGDATDNIMTISGSPDLTYANLYGGDDASGDGNTFTGNTLKLAGFVGEVASINNFENYRFFVPNSLTDGTGLSAPPLLDTSFWGNNASSGGIQVLAIGLESGGTPLKSGDTVTLISADQIENVTFTDSNVEGMKGISLLYNFDVKLESNGLTATVSGQRAHPQTKALAEGRAAGMGFLNQGADLVSGEGMNNALLKTKEAQGSNAVFGTLSYGSSRYKTGSHVDVEGISLLAGIASRSNSASGSLLKGIFLESGWGNYDSYNSFTNQPSVSADGDVSYYGLGALIRRDMPSGNYLEGSLRGGRSKTTFGSGDFKNYLGENQSASYTSKPAYYGAHIGFGRAKANGNKTLDYYAKYFWTHQNGDDITIAGDQVSFSGSNSSRLRGGVRLSKETPDGRRATYAGLAYEYELDGKAKATVYGSGIDAPSLKGGTGIIELGIGWKKSPESPNTISLSLQGYAGKRQGLSGNVQFRRMF